VLTLLYDLGVEVGDGAIRFSIEQTPVGYYCIDRALDSNRWLAKTEKV
jgi:hypothetical protein